MQTQTKLLPASLLTGEDGEALLHEARLMAQSLLCIRGHRGQDYGECSCCRKIFADIHPDVITVRRQLQKDGKTLRSEIVVDQIREVTKDSVVTPNEAPCKVYIFPEAETLNTSAQNAFLKLLEEPPKGVYFLLCTHNPDKLLPTVRSRCGTYYIGGESGKGDEALTALAEEYLSALGDELTLLRWEAKAEKLELVSMRSLIPVLEEEAVKHLTGSALLALEEQLRECREMLKVNVNSKHIAAMLATYRNEE